MKVLIDIGHPAHVHLFRNFISRFEEDGNTAIVTAKQKDITLQLLADYGIEHTSLGKVQRGMYRKLLNSAGMVYRLLRIVRSEKPDLLISKGSPYLGIVKALTGVPHLLYCMDTEIGRLNEILVQPRFSSHVVAATWSSADLPKETTTRVKILKELAYLHPTYFRPNTEILDQLGVEAGEPFSLLRFVAWDAHHDVGHAGLSTEQKRDLIESLRSYGKVFISSESKLPPDLRGLEIPTAPSDIHHALHYATLHVGEGGTMITEAAVLGTPAIFVSPVAKKLSNFEELERNYEMVWCFDGYQGLPDKIKEIVDLSQQGVFVGRRARILEDMVDTTEFLMRIVRHGWESPPTIAPGSSSFVFSQI